MISIVYFTNSSPPKPATANYCACPGQ